MTVRLLTLDILASLKKAWPTLRSKRDGISKRATHESHQGIEFARSLNDVNTCETEVTAIKDQPESGDRVTFVVGGKEGEVNEVECQKISHEHNFESIFQGRHGDMREVREGKSGSNESACLACCTSGRINTETRSLCLSKIPVAFRGGDTDT